MYALVVNGTVTAAQGALPNAARRQDTQDWVLGLPDAPVALQQACGWYAATDVVQPADTATDTFDRSITLVAGVPTVTWTQRPKTQAELDSATATTNRATLQQQATAALVANRTFTGLASPTNAQTVAQVKALSQQMNGVIRLLLNQLDATN